MKPTLVVLAAGLGSRYGGLKQIDGFGPSGETILDYTVFDAIQSGFGKVVFVISKKMLDEFVPRMKTHFGNSIELEFVTQELDDLPDGFLKPENRLKPWGTGHAIWVTRKVVKTSFCIVNADDFYGRAALEEMARLLNMMNNSEKNGCMVGYRISETLSDHGSVSRGVCEIEGGQLIRITEFKEIQKNGELIIGRNESESVELLESTIVSMNLMGFSSSVFSLVESELEQFLKHQIQNETAEFYAPSILQSLIELEVKIPVRVTDSRWFGVTYPDDKPVVQAQIKRLVESGEYPNSLWSS